MKRFTMIIIFLTLIYAAYAAAPAIGAAAEVFKVPLPEVFYITSPSMNPKPGFWDGIHQVDKGYVIFFLTPPLYVYTDHGWRPTLLFLAAPRFEGSRS